jgi:hypothetical protein
VDPTLLFTHPGRPRGGAADCQNGAERFSPLWSHFCDRKRRRGLAPGARRTFFLLLVASVRVSVSVSVPDSDTLTDTVGLKD